LSFQIIILDSGILGPAEAYWGLLNGNRNSFSKPCFLFLQWVQFIIEGPKNEPPILKTLIFFTSSYWVSLFQLFLLFQPIHHLFCPPLYWKGKKNLKKSHSKLFGKRERKREIDWTNVWEYFGGRVKVEYFKVPYKLNLKFGHSGQSLMSTLRATSMSTLTPKSFSVNIKLNFHVDLLNFDLNNSTRIFCIREM